MRKTKTLRSRVVELRMIRYLIIGIISLTMVAASGTQLRVGGGRFDTSPAAAAGGDNDAYSGPIRISARNTLETALSQSVDSYKDFWQTVGTAFYNSNSEALDIIVGYDRTIEEAAAKYSVDKTVIQSVLFQEIRFINMWDEVDACVQNTYYLLNEREAQNTAPSLMTASVLDPVLTGFYVSDSSTGLGQIFARTAIKALNWYGGTALYDENDWKDMANVWLKLKYDDAYNITMIALICRYNDYILQNEEHIQNPSVRDLFRIYNGSGPSAEKYADAAYQYSLAFKDYNDTALLHQ